MRGAPEAILYRLLTVRKEGWEEAAKQRGSTLRVSTGLWLVPKDVSGVSAHRCWDKRAWTVFLSHGLYCTHRTVLGTHRPLEGLATWVSLNRLT